MIEKIYHGPTVYEAAQIKIKKYKERIEELRAEIRLAEARLRLPYAHTMLEAERIADIAEPFQRTKLHF